MFCSFRWLLLFGTSESTDLGFFVAHVRVIDSGKRGFLWGQGTAQGWKLGASSAWFGTTVACTTYIPSPLLPYAI